MSGATSQEFKPEDFGLGAAIVGRESRHGDLNFKAEDFGLGAPVASHAPPGSAPEPVAHDFWFGQPDPNSFPQKVVGGAAAALEAIPRGILGGKTVDYIDAAIKAPAHMVYGDMPAPESPPEGGPARPQVQQPWPYGVTPPQGFRLATPAQALAEGVRNSEQAHAGLAKFAPISSVGGELMGGAAGGAAAVPAMTKGAIATGAPLLSRAANNADWIARNAAFGGAVAGLSGGDPVTGAAIGGGIPAAVGAAGTILSPVLRPVARAVGKVAPLFSQGARETSVGRTLLKDVGATPIETSGVGALDLAQATNVPEIAAKVDLAPSFNAAANSNLRNAQQTAIQDQIAKIGVPATAADASSAFTNALRQGRSVARSEENRLWTVPKLAETPITPLPVQQSVTDAVASMDPVLRDSMAPQLRALINRLYDAPGTTMRDLNGIRSDLEQFARTSNDGAQRNMARTISNAFMDGMDQVPEIAGVSPVVNAAKTETHFVPGVGDVPVQIGSTGTPGIKADPEISAAYQAARNYTRQMRTMFGAPDPAALLAKNAAGVPRVDASEGARRFFNFSNGSPEGPQSIAQLADFVDTLKQQPQAGAVAQQLRDSARSYVASALTDAARANPGQNFNAKTMQDFLRDNGPWMRSSGLFERPQIDAAHDLLNYADMLRRPEQLLRQVNSATQPRSVRKATFIDEIMNPWARRLIELGGLVGGHHQGGMVGAGAAMLGGAAFEQGVARAETVMREMMAQALTDPKIAQAYMTKASAANRLMLGPQARQAIDAARTAIGSDIAPQFLAGQSPTPIQVSR